MFFNSDSAFHCSSMFIDTHTHNYTEAFAEDRQEMMQRAREAGVQKMLLPNIDVDSIEQVYQLVADFPQQCIPMMGLHPGSVGPRVKEDLQAIKSALYSRKHIAVGEIGMDLYWDTTYVKEQAAAFSEQIGWAKELNLPIVIHAREAFNEIFEILDELNDEQLTGVFHCFTGNQEQAQKIREYGGFKLGIGGVVTYKKSELPEVLKQVDLSEIILETDSPYLPPVPYRGKRNESAYIPYVAEKLSDIYMVSVAEIARQTTLNAENLFRLKEWETVGSTEGTDY